MNHKTYFKLVRPDYGSFHDPKFIWPVKGMVQVKDAAPDGACGMGLHLARTIKDGCQYAGFPFRILKVRPLGPILGEDKTKIRVSKAESLGELPVPEWATKMEKRISELPAEMKAVPWLKGGDQVRALRALRLHFKLLIPFGFNVDLKINVITDRKEAAVAWDTAWDIAWDTAWYAAKGAAWDVAKGAAKGAAWDAARAAAWYEAKGAAWYEAKDVAWGAARVAAWDAARDAARGAAWGAAGDLLPHENPFKPLMDVWKTGCWPIGQVGDTFKLYVGNGTEKLEAAYG